MPFGLAEFKHIFLSDVHTPHYFNEIAIVGLASEKPTGANLKDNMLFYETDTTLWKRYRTAISQWEVVAPRGEPGKPGTPGETGDTGAAGASGAPFSAVAFNLGLAVVGTKQQQVLLPGNFTIYDTRAYADTAPIGASIKINLKINGSSLWNDSDRLIIASGSHSGTNSVLDHTDLTPGDRFSLDVDQVGSSTPGGDDLLVVIYGFLAAGENGGAKFPSGITDASEYETINLAITAANNEGHKFVWMPAGTYDITAPLSLPADGFSLIGAGRKIVTLRATFSIDAVIKPVAKRYLTIGGFRIDGNGDQASKGIWIEGRIWFSKFFDIEIRDIATSALYLLNPGDTLGNAPYWNLFENIQCGRVELRGTHGIYMKGDTNLNTFINVTAAGDDYGIILKNYTFPGEDIRAPRGNVFIAPDIGGGDNCVGVRIDNGGLQNTFINPYIEGVYRSMDIQEKSNIVIGGSFYVNTNDKILAPNGLDFYFYRAGGTTYSHFNENPH